MPWFYLSFAGEEGFRGACVVEGPDATDAVRVAHASGINPGGEVMTIESPDDTPGPFPPYRLLSRAELEKIDGTGESFGELEARGIGPGVRVSMIHEACNERVAFELPTHCRSCGALLMGGATVHGAKCWVRALVREFFGNAN